MRVDQVERMFMLTCRLRMRSDSGNVLEDLGYVAPCGEVVCCACEVTDRGRENKFGKREMMRERSECSGQSVWFQNFPFRTYQKHILVF